MPLPALVTFAVFAALSCAGYAWLTGRMLRHGGRVPVAPFAVPDLAFALVLALFFGALAWIAFRSPPPRLETISARQVWLGEGLQVVIVCGIAAYLGFRKISVPQAMGLRRSPLRMAVYALGLLLLALPAVMFTAWFISQHLPRDVSEEQQIVSLFRSEVQHRHYGGVATILITAALIAPAMEEFLFRGFFYAVFKRFGGAILSAFFTAALFALLHGSLAALGGLFLLALVLTAAYEWTGSLWVPIGMHALFNSLNLLLLLGISW